MLRILAMPGWLSPPKDPVAFTLDGEKVVGARGEPVAAALVAAGKLTLARSPKFHRPRGPACMRGACDGCLLRVDGVPNVMTCLVPAREGLTVTSQNTLGSREIDLLRVTDWFFPDGMNHHELFAGVPGVQSAMQIFARRVAGLGRIPDEGRAAVAGHRRSVEVLVVGAGPAGMAAAVAAARKGYAVEVVDDALTPGGGARALPRDYDAGLTALRDAFAKGVAAGSIRMRSRTVAAGFFGTDLLIVPEGSGAEVVEAGAFIVAAGAHDGVVPFENNDLPGVLSARAACLLHASGVSLGKRVVLLAPPPDALRSGELSFGDAYERLAAPATKVRRVGSVVRVKGSSAVRSVVVRVGEREERITADALVVDAPRSPAYELCEQAGAQITHGPPGYTPSLTDGEMAPGVWAIGEVTGAPVVAAALLRDAEVIASRVNPRRAPRTA